MQRDSNPQTCALDHSAALTHYLCLKVKQNPSNLNGRCQFNRNEHKICIVFVFTIYFIAFMEGFHTIFFFIKGMSKCRQRCIYNDKTYLVLCMTVAAFPDEKLDQRLQIGSDGEKQWCVSFLLKEISRTIGLAEQIFVSKFLIESQASFMYIQ